MRGKSDTVEQITARIATRAHGIVTRTELLDADVPEGRIDRRIEKGALIVEYPGVYRAGHRARSRESDYMAAVKAADGALCGNAAGHLPVSSRANPGHPPK